MLLQMNIIRFYVNADPITMERVEIHCGLGANNDTIKKTIDHMIMDKNVKIGQETKYDRYNMKRPEENRRWTLQIGGTLVNLGRKMDQSKMLKRFTR